eukprot:TRINITY_DN5131_c0_g1_i1.p1 TRINITY_DN5131_c0_g1~~TRINITY_DN5131_c0_g1_i1.p1  ORF type:complete len:356 (+),score=50.41 TRINITY_DN5131_c0_g1_i1:48-1115(+)
MLWVDKHRPQSLDKLLCHGNLQKQLRQLADAKDFPHLLVYGPSGSGKKTRVYAFLRELYGPGASKLRIEHKSFKVAGRSEAVEVTTLASLFHIELNPSEAGMRDRLIVQEVIKEIAQNRPLDPTAGHPTFKTVILNEVDCLSRPAQHALRRTMEKYMNSCRIILCCNSTSKVIDPIRSRCLPIRVPAPTEEEVCAVLKHVAKKESITNLPHQLALTISRQSNRNLRKAILALELAKVTKYPFQDNQTIPRTEWEEYISTIARDIMQDQSPARILQVRAKLYELLSKCIPAELIIKNLTLELLKRVDSEIKPEVVYWAQHYEHCLQLGNKKIFHLEAFVAKFMSTYKRFLIRTFGV